VYAGSSDIVCADVSTLVEKLTVERSPAENRLNVVLALKIQISFKY